MLPSIIPSARWHLGSLLNADVRCGHAYLEIKVAKECNNETVGGLDQVLTSHSTCRIHTPLPTWQTSGKHRPAPLVSHRTEKYFSAGASAGTSALCQEEQVDLNPARPIYTATHFLRLETSSFKHSCTNFFCSSSISTVSSLQFLPHLIAGNKYLRPELSNLMQLCPRSSRQEKADSLWAGNRSRLTSVVHLVWSSFLICNWQVVQFHKSLYSLPVIQCYTEGNFRIDLALLFPAIGLVGISLHTVWNVVKEEFRWHLSFLFWKE